MLNKLVLFNTNAIAALLNWSLLPEMLNKHVLTENSDISIYQCYDYTRFHYNDVMKRPSYKSLCKLLL